MLPAVETHLESASTPIERPSNWVSYHWLLLAVVFTVAAALRLQGIDPDLWWHIRAGEWMLDHRQLLQIDLFSSTRFGAEWQHPDWLAEIIIAAIYRLAGLKGVFLFFAALYTAGVALIMRTSRAHRAVTLVIALLAVLGSTVAAAPKPVLFSFVCFIVFLITLDRADFRTQRIVLPLVMILWSNTHGGFSLGFLLVGAYWFYPLAETIIRNGLIEKTRPIIPPEIRRHMIRFAALAGLVLIASLINPYGVDNLTYLVRSTEVQSGAMSELIQEWLPPDFREAGMQILLGVICANLLLFYLAPRKQVLGMLLVLFFTAMALIHARMILFWAPVAQYFLGQALYYPTQQESAEKPWVKSVFAVVAVLVIMLPATFMLTDEAIRERAAKDYPVRATEYLLEHGRPGNLFNIYHWGGYLQLAAPEYPVFIDGRADLFGDEIIYDKYLRVLDLETGWEDVLTSGDVRYLLIEPEQPLAEHLIASACTPLYEDEISVLFDLNECLVGDQ